VRALEDVEPRALQRLRLALPTRHRQPPTVPVLRERTDRTRMTCSILPDRLPSQIGRFSSTLIRRQLAKSLRDYQKVCRAHTLRSKVADISRKVDEKRSRPLSI
jgi:hypothetical protein